MSKMIPLTVLMAFVACSGAEAKSSADSYAKVRRQAAAQQEVQYVRTYAPYRWVDIQALRAFERMN